MREASGWMGKHNTDHWEIRLDRQLRATNRGYARLVFDPGGTQPATIMVTTKSAKAGEPCQFLSTGARRVFDPGGG